MEKADEVLFVEVKTRTTMAYGFPAEAITSAKRLHLARSIAFYQAHHREIEGKKIRADAVAIVLNPVTHQAALERIPNILEE